MCHMTALGNTRLTAPQRSLADLASRTVDQAAGLIKGPIKTYAVPPDLLTGFTAWTGLAFNPP
jgi:hypothetical protein